MSNMNHSRQSQSSRPYFQSSYLQVQQQQQSNRTRMQRMYQYPASVQDAMMHRRANEFGYQEKLMQYGKAVPLCPCCKLPANTQRIKMWYGTTPSADDIQPDKDFMLNEGSVMFFTFIKMAIVYLLVRFLLSDTYNLMTNLMSNNCDIENNVQLCKDNIFARFSSYNKRTSKDEPFFYVLDLLNLATIVCSIIFNFYYRKVQYEVYKIIDVIDVTQEDYSIFVENIPYFLPQDPKTGINSCLYEQQLKKVFEEKAKKWIQWVKQTKGTANKLEASFYQLIKQRPTIEQSPIVRSVSLCFDLTQLENLNQMRSKLMAQHNENVKNGVVIDQTSFSYIPNQINSLNDQYIQISKKFLKNNTLTFHLSHFVGKAFISFQYAHYKQYFLEEHRWDNQLKMAERPLKLKIASKPSDIYWFNMKISKKQRLISMLYSGLVMFMALCFSFIMLLGLQYYQLISTSPSNPNQSVKQIMVSYLFTFSMTILTIIINYLLEFGCEKLTQMEKHNSKTDYNISLMTKSIISQFINTAFIYYMISVVAELTDSMDDSPLSENGIVTKVTSLVAVSGCIQIILNAVQFKSIYRWFVNKYITEADNMFQVELNQQMQDPQFAFSERYTYYIVNVYIVSFFSYITPYVTIILVPIFIIQYWIDKYNLFRRLSYFPVRLKAFEISVLVFALGNYVFSFKVHPTTNEAQYHIINLIGLLLAVVYTLCIFFIPKKCFEKFSEQVYSPYSYTECQQKFKRVYQLTNPATSFANEPDLTAPLKSNLQTIQETPEGQPELIETADK